MDILLVGYIAFALAVVGALSATIIGIHHAVDLRQERAFQRRAALRRRVTPR